MMKKTGKVLLIVAIAFALLVGTAATAFAEEPPAQGNRQRDDKALTRLFIQYDSDNLDAYMELKAAHQAFHEERRDINQEAKDDARQAFMNILNALLDEEITVVEAREAFDALKEKTDAFKEEAKVILDAKKAENEGIREQLQDIRAQMRDALDEDEVDADQMASLLQQTLVLLQQHYDLDVSTAEQVDALRAEYFAE